MSFLYHAVPIQMEGRYLHPLSRLAELYPHLHAAADAKYNNRALVRRRAIPPLDCCWPDVVFFSPVHPTHIADALGKLGQSLRRNRFFQISAGALDPALAVIQVPTISLEGKTLREDFVAFNTQNLAQHRELPSATEAYYAHKVKQGQKPLLFAGIAHILYKGSLDVSSAEIVTV